MNRVFLTGRATSKPALRSNGKVDTTHFILAVNRNYKNNEGQYEADFINCIAFNKRAEMIANYVEKGDMLGIVGKIQTGSFTRDNGEKQYTTSIVVDELDFLQPKKKDTTKEETPKEEDPFTEFGKKINIDDNFLE